MSVLEESHRLNAEFTFFANHPFDITFTRAHLQTFLDRTWQSAQVHFRKSPEFLTLTHPPFFCFDTENINHTAHFCTMGIHSKPTGGLSVFGNIPNRLAFIIDPHNHQNIPICGESPLLTQLALDTKADAIVWGANVHELQLLTKLGIPKYIEVQILTKRLLQINQPVNLTTAEEKFIPWFHRQSCGFWKHKQEWIAYFEKASLPRNIGNQMFFSLARLANNLPIQNCAICGKPQDVLLYCLEDALASFFLLYECGEKLP